IFSSRSSILLSATASAAAGSIRKIEFFVAGITGPRKIGEATNEPYQLSWNGALPGLYTLTARAVQVNSSDIRMALSAPVPIAVIKSPGNGLPLAVDDFANVPVNSYTNRIN